MLATNYQGQKVRARITMVDPSQRKIYGQVADRGSIAIAVWEVDSAFRWPQVNEVWTIIRQNNIWILGSRLNPDQEAFPITNLSTDPQLRLDGDTIFDLNGRQLLPNVSLRGLGAVGDGVTDDTQAFVNALTTSGYTLVKGSPGDTYLVSAGILVQNTQNLTLDLEGSSILIQNRVGLLQNNDTLFYLQNCSNYHLNNINLIRNSPYTGNQDTNFQRGILVFDSCQDCSASNWRVVATSGVGFTTINNSSFCSVSDSHIINTGVLLTGNSNYNTIQNNVVISGIAVLGPTNTLNRIIGNSVNNITGFMLNGSDLISLNSVVSNGFINLQGTTLTSTVATNQATPSNHI